MSTKSVPMPLEEPEEVCGTLYAAKLLGLSVGTVQSLVEKNELHAWRTRGGHRRITLQSIRDYQRVHGLPPDSEKDALMRVLVVDDDVAALEVIRQTMASWQLPIDCTTMSSAMEAIIDIGSLRPDVLITDLRMPGVDGFELLRTLDGSPNYTSLLVIAMTGLSQKEVAKHGGLPTKTIVVQKPLDLKWLHGFFTSLVASRQLRSA